VVVADAASAIPAPPAITSAAVSAAVAAPFTALVMFSQAPTFAPSGVIATRLPSDLIASRAVSLPTVTGNPGERLLQLSAPALNHAEHA
jgi:hypothetical protein